MGFSVVFIFDLRSQIVADVSDVSNLVFYNQRDLGTHRKGDLGCQTTGLGEHVKVPEIITKNKLKIEIKDQVIEDPLWQKN